MATILADVGENQIAQIVMDDVSHVAVGTGTTTAVNTDTKLQTETKRIAPSSRIRTTNQLLVRTFFANGDLPATAEEFGWFMNGTGTPDSGELLVRHNLQFVKGSQDLFITLQMDADRV